MAEKRASQGAYFPRLDGLRCLAVAGVLPVHFVRGWITHWYADTGDLGVKLFFVLSGYLIGSGLLGYRDRIDGGKATRARAMRVFYVRRLLRLSPVYYAYLLFAAFSLRVIRPYLVWYVLYLQNFLFAFHRELSAYLSHFWTLSIEEQFYLVAPILILSVPRAWIRTLVVVFVAAGFVFRGVGLAAGFNSYAIGMMMPAHMDVLGMGALLAVLRWQGGEAASRTLERMGLWLGLPLSLACRGASALHLLPDLVFLFDNLCLGLLFVSIVAGASRPSNAIGYRLLELPPLLFIGRISYGIYVYHFNVPGLLRDFVFPRLHLSMPSSEGVRFVLYSAVAIAIATASYYLYEQRFNALKSLVSLSPRKPSDSSSKRPEAQGA